MGSRTTTACSLRSSPWSMAWAWGGRGNVSASSETLFCRKAPVSCRYLSAGAAPQEATCLKLELVNGWLFTIDTTRIKDAAVREKVILYQREGYQVLFRHFYGRSADTRRHGLEAPQGEPDLTEPLTVRRQLVTEARQSFCVQSARELWFKLGLPTVPSMFADPRQGDFGFTYTAIKQPEGREAA